MKFESHASWRFESNSDHFQQHSDFSLTTNKEFPMRFISFLRAFKNNPAHSIWTIHNNNKRNHPVRKCLPAGQVHLPLINYYLKYPTMSPTSTDLRIWIMTTICMWRRSIITFISTLFRLLIRIFLIVEQSHSSCGRVTVLALLTLQRNHFPETLCLKNTQPRKTKPKTYQC